MKNENKIKIPWYYKNVRRVKPLGSDPFNGFDFPDRRKKTPDRKPKPDPQPKPVLEPIADPIKEAIYHPDGSEEIVYRDLSTPIPLVIPSRIPSPGTIPLPTYDGKTRHEPSIPGRTLRDAIPNFDLKPRPGVSTAIKMPGGEILFKLMESDPNGKYDDFLNGYNDFTLKLAWNIANPIVIYGDPGYEQVKEFLENYDIYNKEVTRDVIMDYFRKQGVKGKDLTSLPQRIYLFKRAIDTMTIIEDIFVPPVNKGNPWGEYEL